MLRPGLHIQDSESKITNSRIYWMIGWRTKTTILPPNKVRPCLETTIRLTRCRESFAGSAEFGWKWHRQISSWVTHRFGTAKRSASAPNSRRTSISRYLMAMTRWNGVADLKMIFFKAAFSGWVPHYLYVAFLNWYNAERPPWRESGK